MFDVQGDDEQLTAIDLTKKLFNYCAIPIVCAGAIMTGSDLANALRAGAVAGQLEQHFYLVRNRAHHLHIKNIYFIIMIEVQYLQKDFQEDQLEV
jgi:imidazole glycerol phosphate synthase subunit HisF